MHKLRSNVLFLFMGLFCLSNLRALDTSVALDNLENTEIPYEGSGEQKDELVYDTQVLTSLYADRIGDLDRLMFYAQSLIGYLDMHLIKCDEKAAHVWLQQFIDLCNQAKNNDNVITLPLCFQLAERIKLLAQVLDNALATNLYYLTPITISTVRSRPIDISIEALVEVIQAGSMQVQALQYKIDKMGSSWYQRTYNGIRAINGRYQIWNWTKTIAGLSVGVGLSAGMVAALIYVMPTTWLSKDLAKLQEKIDSWRYRNPNAKFAYDEEDKVAIQQQVETGNSNLVPVYTVEAGNKIYQTIDKENGLVYKIGKIDLLKKPLAFIEALSLIVLAEDRIYQFNQRHKMTDWIFKAGDKIHTFLSGVKPEIKDGTQYAHHITLDNACFDFIRKDLDPVQNILDYIKDPEKFIRTNRKITKSLLFVGPPGSGKTEVGLGMLGSINEQNKEAGHPARFRIKIIDPHDLVVWSPEALKYFIEEARQMAPCVIWLDEIHTAGLQVNNSGTFALAELLKELDKLNKNNDSQSQIYFVAATNRPDLLSADLMRPGRFETIHFSVPSFDERKHILQLYVKGKGYRLEAIDFDLIGHVTEGVSRSMLHEIFKKADFKASAMNQQLTTEHLYQTVNELVRHQKNEYYLTSQEEQIIATYQAGAALAHMLLDMPNQLESVTIKACTRPIVEQSAWDMRLTPEEKQRAIKDQHKPEYGRLYTWSDHEQINIETVDTIKKQCKVLLAGSIAQEIILGARSTYREKDRQEAFALAQKIVLEGLVFDSFSDEQKHALKDKALTVLKQAEQEVKDMLLERKETLTRLIALLREQRTLRRDALNELL